MIAASLSLLTAWQNFYVIIGSAAAALTGLMFIVITLIVGVNGRSANAPIAAFGTPTVVHFCAAILIAAVICAPWYVLWGISLLLGLCGFSGVVYIIIITRRALHQTSYQPVLEDWLCHSILPLVAYAALFVGAVVLTIDPVPVLFVIGAVTLVLLFVGIHNAWDTVTYVALDDTSANGQSQAEEVLVVENESQAEQNEA